MHLIFHQGDERSNDNANPFLGESRHLKSDGLTASGRHKSQCIFAFADTGDDLLLQVERTFRFDIAHVRTLSERNTVHYIIRFIIDQFEFDMFLIASHHFTCSVIINMMSAENRFRVIRTERIKLFQVAEELG